jgi:hypothetical protein
MSTLISLWSGRNMTVMRIVRLGVCFLLLGARSVEAGDYRPGLKQCICYYALDGLGQPTYSEPRIFELPSTSDRCSEMPGVFCWVHTGHDITPTLAIHALGCTTCHPGETLGFEVHITNPGGPMLVELKTGARLPDGSTVTILERHEEETIPPGVTVIPLFAGLVLRAGIPAGAYAIEAALLEPELGVTISRHSVALTLEP